MQWMSGQPAEPTRNVFEGRGCDLSCTRGASSQPSAALCMVHQEERFNTTEIIEANQKISLHLLVYGVGGGEISHSSNLQQCISGFFVGASERAAGTEAQGTVIHVFSQDILCHVQGPLIKRNQTQQRAA